MSRPPTSQQIISTRPNRDRKWWALLSVGLSFTMFTLDTSIVNIALPTLTKAFQVHLATAQWVVISYLIVLTALTLSAARLGDLLGRQRLFQLGVILFTISSLLCGIAPTIEWLIAFRVLEGLGAVFIAGLGMAIVTELFASSPQRGLALSLAGMTLSVGAILGPTVGGLLITLGDWRAIFLINIPIGIIATLLFVWSVPSTRVERSQTPHFDVLGAALLAGVMVSFSFGMSTGQQQGFGNVIALSLLAIALIGLGLFLRIEAHVRQPMLDLFLFRNPVLSLNLLSLAVVYVPLSARLAIYPFFLELALKYPTSQVGLIMITMSLTNAIIAPLSGRLVDKVGTRFLIPTGLALLTVGCLLASTFNAQLTPQGYILRDLVMGVGFALWRSPNSVAVMSNAPADKLGIVSGLLNESSMIGQTIGTPLAFALFSLLSLNYAKLPADTLIATLPPDALIFAMHWTFLVMAMLLGAMTLANLLNLKSSNKLLH
ncbi:MAG: MFS transporter [Leptolyngbya sp. BL-A-14]